MLNSVLLPQHSVAGLRHLGNSDGARRFPDGSDEQIGDRIGLIMADLQDNPTIWEPTPGICGS